MLIFTLAGTKVLLTVFMFTSSESSLTAQVEAIPIFRNNTRILFQGDSITDGKRDRGSDPNHMLGHGYVYIIASKYGNAFPTLNLKFINRGISGNRIIDLAGRWKQDTIDVKPDILSILIGINDNMHWKYKNNTFENWIPFEEFENTYDNLLKEFRVHYPKSYLVLCLPFTLRVNGKYWSVDGFEEFEKNLKKRFDLFYVP